MSRRSLALGFQILDAFNMSGLTELLDLLLPTRCALCARVGSPLCAVCTDALQFSPRTLSRIGGDEFELNGWAASEFGGFERKLIHAFKEEGQTSLAPTLIEPMVPLLAQVIGERNGVMLVPVPSSRVNFRRRGYMPTKILARGMARRSRGLCQIQDALFFKRLVDDQASLDSKRRQSNLADSMRAKPNVFGREIVIFDDVVTTGATVMEAARALISAGGKVIGFLAFAETILKRQSKT